MAKPHKKWPDSIWRKLEDDIRVGFQDVNWLKIIPICELSAVVSLLMLLLNRITCPLKLLFYVLVINNLLHIISQCQKPRTLKFIPYNFQSLLRYVDWWCPTRPLLLSHSWLKLQQCFRAIWRIHALRQWRCAHSSRRPGYGNCNIQGEYFWLKDWIKC
jgi:hypothetical protein